jgi:hypothetical protein
MQIKIPQNPASRFSRLWACTLAALCLAVCLASGAAGWDATPRSNHERIESLIALLGDKDYFVRERAQQDLVKIGFEAFDALSAAENHDDIEISARARFLVRQMEIEWTVDGDPAEVKRLLQNYALKDDAAHLATIEQLAELEGDQGLAVLCRLARFEKSVCSRSWRPCYLRLKPKRRPRKLTGVAAKGGDESLAQYASERAVATRLLGRTAIRRVRQPTG